MTIVTVISVSTPAVKDTVLYARDIKSRYGIDVDFRIHYLCGGREDTIFNVKKANEDISECDLVILDLMGANDAIVDTISESLRKTKCQSLVISGFGPIKNKIGKYDEKRFRMDAHDAEIVKRFSEYWRNAEGNDIASAYNMIFKGYFGLDVLPDPEPISSSNGAFIKDPLTGKLYDHKEDFISDNPRKGKKSTVVLFFNSHKYPTDSQESVRNLYNRLREFSYVLPVALNRVTSEDVPKIKELIGEDADLAIDLIAFRFIAGPMQGSSTEAMKLLNELNVPFLRPFFLGRSDKSEWIERTAGLTVMEFMLNVFMAELDGAICTFPVGANEDTWTAEEYGITFSEIKLIDDRVDRICEKVKGYLRLKELKNEKKRIAIVGYNYPPGEGNLFGGAFLDTFSSMCQIIKGLKDAGYNVPDVEHDALVEEFVKMGITNGGEWIQPEIDKMIHSPAKVGHKQNMVDIWGKEPGDVLADKRGYLIPGIIKGNLFLGLQPPRTRPENDQSGSYHDPYLPPHHQYLGFYEWIRDEFKADAVIHIGTHGTVEFLPGKEVGMSGDCYPDIAVGGIPHFYLYYVGNPSEAMIAKRRTHAGLLSYMCPPYIKSGLYGELSELEGLIAEYRESLMTDAGRGMKILEGIKERSEKMRLPSDIDELEHELIDIRESLIPSGFHTYGTPFTKEEAETFAIQSMMFTHGDALPLTEILRDLGFEGDADIEADCIYRSFNTNGSIPEYIKDDERALRSLEYERDVFGWTQNCHEMSNLLRALNSEFIDVKPGDDFLRTPEIIPTGYNIVQFDPSKIPTSTAFLRGAEAAENTIKMHMEEEGTYPESIAMIMWGIETSRSQGASIGQMLTYLGIRQIGTTGTFENRFEIIPIEELGRPRIDVTVTICGFFRDMFSGVIEGLNRLLRKLFLLNESDENSHFAKNCHDNYEKLKAEGYSDDDALDLATCRLFGPKEGLYGTGMTNTVNSSEWKDETELGDIFEESLRHAYSLKHRGFDSKGLMRNNHSKVDVVSQIRQNVEYELIDLDHYYEFFGGLSKTVEISRGSKAKMYITDNAGPRIKTVNVKTSIEHGVRTRLLNPVWIDGMLKTDYHGVQKINDRFENVLGLAATTGAVDTSVFSDMETTYLKDKEMRKRLMDNNLFAYMGMLDRLSEAYRRGYWNATKEELELLRQAYLEAEDSAEDFTN